MHAFLRHPDTQHSVSGYCTTQNIEWHFTPKQAPCFGVLWQAAVKSFKQHFRRVVRHVRLTHETLATTLAQIEACLNSRPLAPLPSDEDGSEAIVGRPLEALPDPPVTSPAILLLQRWHLCQTLKQHFWHRWSTVYACANCTDLENGYHQCKILKLVT